MLSLQAITVKNILENLAINHETLPIIEQFLYNHPKLFDSFLNKNGLYHVYFRQRDPYIFHQEEQKDIELIKSFSNNDEAINWIITNGKDIVIEQEDNYSDAAIILVVIHHDNNGLYCMGEGPNRFSCISFEQHQSFAFSINGYLMLLKEHIDCIKNNHYENTAPIWIHYYKNDCSYINGVDLNELNHINVVDQYNKQILTKILHFYSRT